MASALKRKRGPVEVLDTPKRSKSVKSETPNPLQKLGSEKVGWDAAFGALQSKKELVQTNGNNGDVSDSEGEHSDSSEALDYEALQEKGSLANGLDASARKRALKGQEHSKTWKLSESIGGRMINVDPAFTADEKYAYRSLPYLWNVTDFPSLADISSLPAAPLSMSTQPRILFSPGP
jgi:NET1-associated nuclear protein 1 (U3 small nucleolar RNA-associated protein 17)